MEVLQQNKKVNILIKHMKINDFNINLTMKIRMLSHKFCEDTMRHPG